MEAQSTTWQKLIEHQDEILVNLSRSLQQRFPSVDWQGYVPILYKHITRTVKTSDTTLSARYLNWFNVMVKNRLNRENFSHELLDITHQHINQLVNSGDEEVIKQILSEIKSSSSQIPLDDHETSRLDVTLKHGNLAHLFFNFLLDGDRNAATLLIKDAISDGIPIEEIYLDIIQPCMEEVGRLWELNKLTVAQEHYITAATQVVMSQMTPYTFKTQRNGKKLIASSVSNDLHELGIRMVTDIFELDGWDTHYLGGNLPISSLIDEVKRWKPDVLALSVTLGSQLDDVEDIIREIKSREETHQVKVMVGGKIINENPELKLNPEPDHYARDVRDGLSWANNSAA